MKQQWKLTLSYDGSLFHGWQIQPGLPTVQGTFASALRQVLGEEVSPQGSGRTDAGVHALEQVATFASKAEIPPERLLLALNRLLPASIRVLSAEKVSANFHARLSARAKIYEYRIFQRRLHTTDGDTSTDRICSPFLAPFVWDCRWALDRARMNLAAAAVCGTHDFTSFAASDPDLSQRIAEESRSGTNPVKTIWQSDWAQDGDLLSYTVRGSGFLHHMVRNLVGTFVDVGRGRIEPHQVPNILAARDRTAAGATAPANGLFLKSVEYDADDTVTRATI